MSRITVKEVTTKKEMNLFARFGNELYQSDPCYVPDLELDIKGFFDPKRNPSLSFAEVQPFLAYDEKGQVVGRVAAVINREAIEKFKLKSVRFTYFDFIDDREVSAALLLAVEQWGQKRGMDTIQGPLGITDFDKEGMQVDDFDVMGSMIEIHNYPYYPEHMEAMGFEKAADWVQIRVDVPAETPAIFTRVARIAERRSGIKLRLVTKRDFIDRGYGVEVFHLLNRAYAPLYGFTEIPEEMAQFYTENYLQFVDPKLVPLLFNKDGEMVGVAVTMTGMSEALRKTDGKLFPTGWWHLLRALKWKRSDCVQLLLIAVDPRYQGDGLNAMFFDYLIPIYQQMGFKFAETGPQLETNSRELSQWKALGPKLVKRRRCYIRKI